MTPLRILHTDFHRGWGGQASRIVMLSRELIRRGHHVTVAAPEGELALRARRVEGLRVEAGFRFRPPSHVTAFLADVGRMRALLREGSFDIVDVHGSQDTWVTAMTRILTGRPHRLVLTRHNTKRVRFNAANRWLYGRLIDHLILVDDSIRDRYAPFFEAGVIDAARITCVPSAYRADLFHSAVNGARVRAEFPHAAKVIGVAGRLVTDKGHTYLLQAVQRLRARMPHLVICFAGAGPHEGALRAEVAARGLSDVVRFLGFRDDIAEVQAAFDIAVLPSVGCDASSASIKEAMALGVPVIASDIGGARGIVRDGRTGLIVPAGDAGALEEALRRLLEDPDAARAMAQRARTEVAARYSVARLADGTLEAYAAALKDAPGAGLARNPGWAERRSA